MSGTIEGAEGTVGGMGGIVCHVCADDVVDYDPEMGEFV